MADQKNGWKPCVVLHNLFIHLFKYDLKYFFGVYRWTEEYMQATEKIEQQTIQKIIRFFEIF